MGCDHLTIDNHRVCKSKGPVWTCTACKKEFTWTEESSYYGMLECLKCGRDVIDAVFCSTPCSRKYGYKLKEALDLCKTCLGQAPKCRQCDGRWHSCIDCGAEPKNFIDPLSSDETMAQFLKEHPLNDKERKEIEGMVRRLSERFRVRANLDMN